MEEDTNNKEVLKINKEALLQGILIVFMICVLGFSILIPISELFKRAFMDGEVFIGVDNFKKYFQTPSLAVAIKNTLFVSITTAFISVILGTFYAYAITRTQIKGKLFFKAIAIMPLFAPTMLYGMSLIYLFGNKGIVTNYLNINISLYGPVGIIISEVMYAFPQVFLIMLVGFSLVDYRMYEAAETLGCSSINKFFKVTLPSVRYAIISAFFVSFVLSFTDFGAPKVVGGNYNLLATDIYKQVIGQQNISMGAVVGILMLVPVVIAFIVDRIISKRQSATITSKSILYKVKSNKLRDRAFFIFCLGVASSIMIIIFMALMASIIKAWPYNLSLTLDHYKFKQTLGNGIETYFNSLKIAFLTAILGTIFTFMNAYLIEKLNKFKNLRQAAYFLSIMPLALPGLVIGLSYILFFNNPSLNIPFIDLAIPNPFNFLYGTLGILVLANIVHFYSVPFITANTALKMLDKEYEVIAKSLNIPLYKLFSKVTVPMCFSAILEIAAYYFVNSMVTVSAIVFLYTADFKLASIAIVNMEEAGNVASAAAMCILILITNIIVRLVYEYGTRKFKKRTEAWQNNKATA